MTNEINLINNYKKSLISILTIPIILIGFIYISYGEVFDVIIAQQTNPFKFYQLHDHLSVFSIDSLQIPLRILPLTTTSMGYYSVISIYILFSGWLVLFAISSYLQLSQRTGSKISILFELSFLLLISIISISPKLNLWLCIFGFSIIVIVFVMLLLYWVYEIKTKQ